jgi:glycosyltransferase involved in cell wall biosynthesis
MTPAEAKLRLGIGPGERTLLFFGRIGPYKGLELLIEAFQSVAPEDKAYRLVIAGAPKHGHEKYWEDIKRAIESHTSRSQVIQKIEFVPDADTEIYFKAADALVLPYSQIFQSGVLFLAYNFGLPVIATRVGSFEDDIIEGQTGFLCQPGDPADLAASIRTYFASSLFQSLNDRRKGIQDYANRRYSWAVVGETTRSIYAELLRNPNRG